MTQYPPQLRRRAVGNSDARGVAADAPNPVEDGGATVGGDRPFTGGEDGGHDPEVERVLRSGEGVDAPMHSEQEPGFDPPADVVLREPEGSELPHGHEAVLAAG